MKEKERFVIDTSIFTNPESYIILGNSPSEAFVNFINLSQALPNIQLYMPPSVYHELLHFIEKQSCLPSETELVIRLKPPRKYDIKVSAAFLYELIDEIRSRINKGLRVAEGAVREVNQQNPEVIITKLRERYRQALREGIIDSKEDLELVLLAMELDATIVSMDQGVKRWAEKLGIRLLDPKSFFMSLKTLSSQNQS